MKKLSEAWIIIFVSQWSIDGKGMLAVEKEQKIII